MSYQVLARKWRPKTFADVVGQGHILTALANGLKDQRLHHAYLFSGTRGVGKTSIARLFAKGLNCVHGITAQPCGECEHCKAIEQGNFIDLIEIDAASRTKVEDTRELLDNVQYKPVVGRFKVYLIDEVHMLSRHSFNALLKTLEEPPEYVKFLLATTDPQKLPVTILSRCLQFHLKALDETQIEDHLAHILREEQISFENAALAKLAKAAQGSIRDSLSLTDQAIAMGDRHVSVEVVNAMLGLMDDGQAIDILYALHQGNGESLMQTLQKVADNAGDWDELLAETAEKLHQIALMQLLPQSTAAENDHLAFLAKHISPEDVQFFYQVIVNGRKELINAPNRRIGAEMTLLRALAFHPKFLTAAPKANRRLAPSANAPQSAVENTGNYVDMPVLSQNIKATYPAEAKTSRINQTPALASLAALDALAHLNQLETAERQAHKAEVQAVVSETLDAVENTRKMTALPVREMTPPKIKSSENAPPQTMPDDFTPPELPSDVESAQHSIEDNAELAKEEQDIQDAESYRWEWRNPELAKTDQAVRPSEIKQAILKDITPELREKIIQRTCEQDEWTKIVESSGIIGFGKELALNCFLLNKDEQRIQLGISTEKAYLQQERRIKALTEELSRLYDNQPISISLQVTDQPQLTPMDYRRNVYQSLREQARDDLRQDRKIQLLQKEFNVQLDLESIRPV